MRFHEIELTSPERPVQFTHSLAMDMIQGRRSDQNIDWTDRFYSLPWDDVKGLFPHAYEDASRLNSLINMNYQVCNSC